MFFIEFRQQLLNQNTFLKNKMKKLLDIIKLDQLHQVYQLELDFKTQRHNLKRYLKSLKELKNRLKINNQYFANLTQQTKKIVQSQDFIKKKNSEFDYFILNGVKPLKAFNIQIKKVQNFTLTLHNKVKDLTETLIKYLDQSKESYNRVSKEHEKMVKDYADKCFPETGGILYMIGFVNTDKIKKTEDMMKEQSLLKEAQMYNKILNNYLDQMEELKNAASELFSQHYIGATSLWISCCEDMHKQMNSYEVNEEEIQDFYKETGGGTTDRSDKSTKSNPNDQSQI